MASPRERQSDLLRVKLDQALAQHDLDRRLDPRVTPSTGEPVLVMVDGLGLKASSVSRSGLEFPAGDLADPGWLVAGELALPGAAHPLPVVLAVLTKDDHGMARARFHEPSEETGRAIERYVERRRQELLALGA